MERTLVLIKPDAVQRGFIGKIISRIENKGLKIVGIKMIEFSDDLANEHYHHLSDKPFFKEIQEYMSATPIIAICVEGLACVDTVRNMTGETLSRKAEVGTLRGDLAMSIQCNLVHTSDSTESSGREIDRFFSANELFSYEKLLDVFIYSRHETNE